VDEIAGQRHKIIALAGKQGLQAADLPRLHAAMLAEVEIREMQDSDAGRREAGPGDADREPAYLNPTPLDQDTVSGKSGYEAGQRADESL
jgi:hypothetical protein